MLVESELKTATKKKQLFINSYLFKILNILLIVLVCGLTYKEYNKQEVTKSIYQI